MIVKFVLLLLVLFFFSPAAIILLLFVLCLVDRVVFGSHLLEPLVLLPVLGVRVLVACLEPRHGLPLTRHEIIEGLIEIFVDRIMRKIACLLLGLSGMYVGGRRGTTDAIHLVTNHIL